MVTALVSRRGTTTELCTGHEARREASQTARPAVKKGYEEPGNIEKHGTTAMTQPQL